MGDSVVLMSNADVENVTRGIRVSMDGKGGGHRLYSPKGIGALYIKKGINNDFLIHGASQESGRRAGTENVPYMVGLGAACEIAIKSLSGYPDAPVPEGLAPKIAALRSRRKKLSGVCLFLVLTALVMGLRATFFYNYYLAIGPIIAAALYAWRVYRKPVSPGWI